MEERRRLFIGGEWAEGDGLLEVISPHTEQPIAAVASAGPADVDRAVRQPHRQDGCADRETRHADDSRPQHQPVARGHPEADAFRHGPEWGGRDDPVLLADVQEHRVELSHPAAFDEPGVLDQFETVFAGGVGQVSAMFAPMIGHTLGPDDVERYSWRLIEKGLQMDLGTYLGALAGLQLWSRRAAAWWADGFDVLVTPTISEPPPPLGQLGASDADPQAIWERNLELIPFTPLQNATGQPAVSLPLYWNDAGLPIGVQFAAPFGDELTLLQLATQLEAAQPWFDRRAPALGADGE